MPVTGLQVLIGLIVTAVLLAWAMWHFRATAETPWVCDVCHSRFPSDELLGDHEAAHRRPVMPGILCTCDHMARAHFCGDGPCRSCECESFAAVSLRAVA